MDEEQGIQGYMGIDFTQTIVGTTVHTFFSSSGFELFEFKKLR